MARLRSASELTAWVVMLHAACGCERARDADSAAPSACVLSSGEAMPSTTASPTSPTLTASQSSSASGMSPNNGSSVAAPATSPPADGSAPNASEQPTDEQNGAGAAGGMTDQGSASPSGGAAGLGGSDTASSGAVASPSGSGDAGRGGAEPSPAGSTSMLDAGTSSDRCDVGVYDGTPPKVLELEGDTFAHDPTLLEAGGVFFRYWTGDYVPAAVSNDLQTWSNASPVYPNTYPQWVNEWKADHPSNTFNFPWAPDVSHFGGQYHLYASFSAFFGRNASCITHLTTSAPDAEAWVDAGPVICSESDSNFNAIDPDVALDVDGNPWLAFGSFWDGIQLMPLDEEGARLGDELLNIAWADEIEAPVLFRRCGYYYLFVSHGLCCPGENRDVDDLTYRVVVGRATDIRGPYLDRDGTAMLEGGGSLVVEGDGEQFAAAGHSDVLVVGDTIYNAYHAYRLPSGNATLRIVEMPFDAEGWPVPAGP